MSMRLYCVGTGDAFGSGGRLNSCFHLQAAGRQLLLDCGCSSIAGLQAAGIALDEIELILISHLHGDHFGGIPFLLLEAKYVSQRTRPLTLLGPPGLQHQVEAALDALYPGALDDGCGFPIHYHQLDPGTPWQDAELKIISRPVKHGSSPDVFGLRVEVAGRVISYSGDTEWTENLLELSAGSDLFIVECFNYSEPSPSHLDYRTLLAKRQEFDCKRLVLTHLGVPMLERLAELELEVLCDGDLLEL